MVDDQLHYQQSASSSWTNIQDSGQVTEPVASADRYTIAEVAEPLGSRPGQRRRLLLVQPLDVNMAAILDRERFELQQMLQLPPQGSERTPQSVPRRSLAEACLPKYNTHSSCQSSVATNSGNTIRLTMSADAFPQPPSSAEAASWQPPDQRQVHMPISRSNNSAVPIGMWKLRGSPEPLTARRPRPSAQDHHVLTQLPQQPLPPQQPQEASHHATVSEGSSYFGNDAPGAVLFHEPATMEPSNSEPRLPYMWETAPLAADASASSVVMPAGAATGTSAVLHSVSVSSPAHLPDTLVNPGSAADPRVQLLSPAGTAVLAATETAPSALGGLPQQTSDQQTSRSSEDRLKVRRSSKSIMKDIIRGGVYSAACLYRLWAHGDGNDSGSMGPTSGRPASAPPTAADGAPDNSTTHGRSSPNASSPTSQGHRYISSRSRTPDMPACGASAMTCGASGSAAAVDSGLAVMSGDGGSAVPCAPASRACAPAAFPASPATFGGVDAGPSVAPHGGAAAVGTAGAIGNSGPKFSCAHVGGFDAASVTSVPVASVRSNTAGEDMMPNLAVGASTGEVFGAASPAGRSRAFAALPVSREGPRSTSTVMPIGQAVVFRTFSAGQAANGFAAAPDVATAAGAGAQANDAAALTDITTASFPSQVDRPGKCYPTSTVSNSKLILPEMFGPAHPHLFPPKPPFAAVQAQQAAIQAHQAAVQAHQAAVQAHQAAVQAHQAAVQTHRAADANSPVDHEMPDVQATSSPVRPSDLPTGTAGWGARTRPAASSPVSSATTIESLARGDSTSTPVRTAAGSPVGLASATAGFAACNVTSNPRTSRCYSHGSGSHVLSHGMSSVDIHMEPTSTMGKGSSSSPSLIAESPWTSTQTVGTSTSYTKLIGNVQENSNSGADPTKSNPFLVEMAFSQPSVVSRPPVTTGAVVTRVRHRESSSASGAAAFGLGGGTDSTLGKTL